MRINTCTVLQHMAPTPSSVACTFEECTFFTVTVTFVCIFTSSYKPNIFKINSRASRLSCKIAVHVNFVAITAHKAAQSCGTTVIFCCLE